MNFFEEFNKLSADDVLSKIELDVAKDGKSYVCPKCGHGKGGDGIRPRMTNKGQTRYKCFGCDEDFSNYDLACAALGLNADDRAAAVRELKDLFGLDDDKKSARSSKKIPGSGDTVKYKVPLGTRDGVKAIHDGEMDSEKKSAAEPKNYERFYNFCKGNRDKFLAAQGGSYRAITAATFEKYGVEFYPDFDFETKDGAKLKTCAMIIPYVKGTTVDKFHFVARAASDTIKAFSQHGEKASLYEPLSIRDDNVMNFVVESELDALSIAQVFDGYEGLGVAATGGASKWRKAVDELSRRFPNTDQRAKVKVVCLFDNDEKGALNVRELVPALRAANFPAVFSFLEGEMAGTQFKNSDTGEVTTVPKVDANDLLKLGGGKLMQRLIDICDDAGDKLESQAATMTATAAKEKQAVAERGSILTISLAEYFKADFFTDVELTSKYATRSTGFENLDSAQIFLPGLYIVGAKPGAGKTTWCWQLLNQLADRGEFCVYASYEMSRFELATKTLARKLYQKYPNLSERLNLTSTNIRRGAGKGQPEILEMANAFEQTLTNLHVAELTNTGAAELCKHVFELSKAVCAPPVLCLDYLQILPNKDAKATTKDKIDAAMLAFKNFQRDTGATVLIISAFNRANGNDAKFSSFRESSAIEYSADVCWALQRRDGDDDDDDDSKVPEPRPMTLKCLKNRFGAPYSVQFDYYAAHDYFEPCEEKKRSSFGH